MEKFFDGLSKQLVKGVSRRDMLTIAVRAGIAALASSTGIGSVWATAISRFQANSGACNPTALVQCHQGCVNGYNECLLDEENTYCQPDSLKAWQDGANQYGPCPVCDSSCPMCSGTHPCSQPQGTWCCLGVCVDQSAFQSDPYNCGSGGNCCNPGTICCTGICVNQYADPNNCGSCGNDCTGGKICQNRVCVCPPGFTDCSGVCKSLSSDPYNFGTCNKTCLPTQICATRFCECPSSAPTLCSGVCKNLGNDRQNCGTCGNVCSGGKTCQ